MTQEEKAKAYDEALTIAKRIISKNCSEVEKLCLKSIFPELAESEDERIRKAIVLGIKRCADAGSIFGTIINNEGVNYHDVLAWLEKQKEQKLVEKQDYSGLNDLEKAIHRGFLAAGVENVPVGIIKETAKECLTNIKPAEWSEEDGKKIIFLERLIRYNVPEGQYDWTDGPKGGFVTKLEAISMLKSLRPSWKPSEEQKSVAERFARIVRGNLIGIDEEVQQKFEQLYFEVTGNKMYGGYND